MWTYCVLKKKLFIFYVFSVDDSVVTFFKFGIVVFFTGFNLRLISLKLSSHNFSKSSSLYGPYFKMPPSLRNVRRSVLKLWVRKAYSVILLGLLVRMNIFFLHYHASKPNTNGGIFVIMNPALRRRLRSFCTNVLTQLTSPFT